MTEHAQSDGTLLEEFAANGREAAFEEIIRRHSNLVFSVCMRVLGEAHDAEDAAQAVFLTLAQKAKTLQGHPSVGAWLHHVAWHVAMRAKEAGALQHKRERESGIMAEKVREQKREQEQHWEALKPLLDRELDALPEKYRLPLILHHLEGKSQQEIATLLRCSEGTVSSQLTRGRVMLKDRLAQRGLVLSVGLLAALVSKQVAAATLSTGFLVTTTKAAVLIAAGQTAATSVVSAQVAALTQGAIKMIYVAKLKMAAVAILAFGIFAGGVSIVTYKAMADGEQVVKAGVETDPAPSGPEVEEKPKEPEPVTGIKDGLSVTLKPTKLIFGRNESITLRMTFNNVSKKGFTLYGTNYYMDWNWSAENSQTHVAWNTVPLPRSGPLPSERRLEPGQSLDIDVSLQYWNKIPNAANNKKIIKYYDEQFLPYGRYQLSVNFSLGSPGGSRDRSPIFWTGDVSSGPVAFEIKDSPFDNSRTLLGKVASDKALKTFGDHGCFVIRSAARWEAVQKELMDLGWKKPAADTLRPDFSRDMIVGVFKSTDILYGFTCHNVSGDIDKAEIRFVKSYLINKGHYTPTTGLTFAFTAIPQAREVAVTVATFHPGNGGPYPTPDKAKLEWTHTVDASCGDVVDGLSGAITPEKNTIVAGDDIGVRFELQFNTQSEVKEGAFSRKFQSAFVWDGVYSEGYRNHAFLVEMPDGKTQLLRRAVQDKWLKNIPHPVEVKVGQPYVLTGDVYGQIHKSLKALGLDTSVPGIYKITGIYMEEGGTSGLRAIGGQKEVPMWGGNIATNTVEVVVTEK